MPRKRVVLVLVPAVIALLWWSRHASKRKQIDSVATAASQVDADTSGMAAPRFQTLQAPSRVHVSQEVRQALLDFARRPAHNVGLRPGARAAQSEAMRRLIAPQIDLDKAHRRQSERFARTSFTQDVTVDRPMRLGAEHPGDERTLNKPMRVIFREGTDTLSLTKVVPQGGPSGTGMNTSDALAATKDFFTKQGLLSENGADQIGRSEVRERHIDMPPVDGKRVDFLAQQDVRLTRAYDGKPVINSHATLGVLPDGNEIVQVQVSNWVPTDDHSKAQIKPAFNEQQAAALASTIESNMVARVEADSANDPDSIHIDHVTEGWFQDQNAGLVPVLVFEGTSGEPDKTGEKQSVVVAVNPLGDSTAIETQGRVVRPHREPAPLAQSPSAPDPKR